MGRTVTPYLSAIPWRVSVGHTVCFTKLSVRVMCLAVLPYFFRALPVSRMHRRSSISLAPFRSIVRPPGCSWEAGPYHNSSTYVSGCASPGDPLARLSHNLSEDFLGLDDSSIPPARRASSKGSRGPTNPFPDLPVLRARGGQGEARGTRHLRGAWNDKPLGKPRAQLSCLARRARVYGRSCHFSRDHRRPSVDLFSLSLSLVRSYHGDVSRDRPRYG